MDRTKGSPAREYALVFDGDGIRVTLQAGDRAEAFAQAKRLVQEGRPATLLEDGEPLATLSYSAAGFWKIADVSAAA